MKLSIRTNSDLYYSNEDYVNYQGCVMKQYIILKQLGNGAHAYVWLAFDKNKKILVAIKIGNRDSGSMKHMNIELENYNNIGNHEHIIDKLDNFIHDGHICIVFEYMTMSSYDLLKKWTIIPEQIVDKMHEQIKKGIEHIHNKDYIHADIKPENILIRCEKLKDKELMDIIHKLDLSKLCKNKMKYIRHKICEAFAKEKLHVNSDSSSTCYSDEDEETDDIFTESSDDEESETKDTIDVDINEYKDIVFKLADFGHLRSAKLDKCDCATLYYAPPEYFLGLSCGKSIDYWAFGCTIHELATGEILFDVHANSMISYNRIHYYKIIEVVGNIPEHIISKSPKRYVYYKLNGELKCNTNISNICIYKKNKNISYLYPSLYWS